MALAIFDLDETLISADSDHAWGEFVASRGLVDADSHRRRSEAFYQDYRRGELDIDAYLKFSCTVLAMFDMEKLARLRDEFFEERVKPLLLPKANALIERHKKQGDCLLVVTATIQFVTEPIVRYLGIDNLIAPLPEVRGGRYTGNVTGTPSYREGKVIRLKEWLNQNQQSLEGSWFYSDSRNDIPLLELVDNPVAVDPDPVLETVAKEREWPIISLRQ